jgi:universal stress protein E
VIARYAANHDVNLLVMGTIGRIGLPGFFIGNTAEDVLNVVRCSVLAVKPHGFQSPVKL